MPRFDVFTREKRSEVMRAIKSANTGPEIALRKALAARGLRFRVNARDLPGSPDLFLPEGRAAIFVHGCFWHGHSCARGARTPKTNAVYWREKIARNKRRDGRAVRALRADGCRVFTVFTCRDLERSADRIARALAP